MMQGIEPCRRRSSTNKLHRTIGVLLELLFGCRVSVPSCRQQGWPERLGPHLPPSRPQSGYVPLAAHQSGKAHFEGRCRLPSGPGVGTPIHPEQFAAYTGVTTLVVEVGSPAFATAEHGC